MLSGREVTKMTIVKDIRRGNSGTLGNFINKRRREEKYVDMEKYRTWKNMNVRAN